MIQNYDKVQSIEKGELIYKRSIFEVLETYFFLVYAICIVSIGVAIERMIVYEGEFTGFLLYFFAPFLILGGLYSAFRCIQQNKLECVRTNYGKSENEKLLISFLSTQNMEVCQNRNNIIIVIDEHMLSYNGLWRKKYVFIIDDFKIYFNIRKLYPTLSPPVLISHLLLKNDLSRFLQNPK